MYNFGIHQILFTATQMSLPQNTFCITLYYLEVMHDKTTYYFYLFTLSGSQGIQFITFETI